MCFVLFCWEPSVLFVSFKYSLRMRLDNLVFDLSYISQQIVVASNHYFVKLLPFGSPQIAAQFNGTKNISVIRWIAI